MSFPLVVTPAELQQYLQTLKSEGKSLRDAGMCLVDLRSAEAYAEGHLQGAVNVSPTVLSRSAPPVGGLLPEPEAVNTFLSTIGARMGDQIIAYDGGLETPAARLMWVLDAYGYEAGSWLNGGYRAWQVENLPVTTEVFTVPAGDLTLSLIGDNVISVDTLMSELARPSVKILDVRSEGEYRGTDIRAANAGHVPGATHTEWTTMLDENGRLLDDAVLENMLTTLNASHDDTVVVYCQSHQRSSVTYVALKHLGYNDVRAIDGAWSAWGNRPDTPKES